MPHYPKPFFRKSRQLWYVQLDGTQINLGAEQEDAFKRYHELMAKPKATRVLPTPVAPTEAVLVVVLCDRFLDWVQRYRSAGTYQWYWWRLQSFVCRYPELTADELWQRSSLVRHSPADRQSIPWTQSVAKKSSASGGQAPRSGGLHHFRMATSTHVECKSTGPSDQGCHQTVD